MSNKKGQPHELRFIWGFQAPDSTGDELNFVVCWGRNPYSAGGTWIKSWWGIRFITSLGNVKSQRHQLGDTEPYTLARHNKLEVKIHHSGILARQITKTCSPTQWGSTVLGEIVDIPSYIHKSKENTHISIKNKIFCFKTYYQK